MVRGELKVGGGLHFLSATILANKSSWQGKLLPFILGLFPPTPSFCNNTEFVSKLETVKICFLLLFSVMQCIYPESVGVPGGAIPSEACGGVLRPRQCFEVALQHIHFSWLAYGFYYSHFVLEHY